MGGLWPQSGLDDATRPSVTGGHHPAQRCAGGAGLNEIRSKGVVKALADADRAEGIRTGPGGDPPRSDRADPGT